MCCTGKILWEDRYGVHDRYQAHGQNLDDGYLVDICRTSGGWGISGRLLISKAHPQSLITTLISSPFFLVDIQAESISLHPDIPGQYVCLSGYLLFCLIVSTSFLDITHKERVRCGYNAWILIVITKVTLAYKQTTIKRLFSPLLTCASEEQKRFFLKRMTTRMVNAAFLWYLLLIVLINTY